jgi:predicted MFS family arabinose efflux permease
MASTGVKGSRGKGSTPASGITGHFDLSETQDGSLFSAFMAGLLIGSPTFAEASKYFNPFRIIAIGLAFWCAASIGCACSVSFGMLFICRCFVGLGEASFCSMASPFIDDVAPPSAKTRWLGIFFLTIPVGVAFGFIFGGVVGHAAGWRAPFVLQALFMAPFVFFCTRSKPLPLRGSAAGHTPAGSSNAAKLGTKQVLRSFWKDFAALLRLPLFSLTCLALAAHTATVGCYSYYGPKAASELFQLKSADMVFGATTVLTGVAGTLGGAYVLDRRKASVASALAFCAIACAVSFVVLLLAFQARTLGLFIPVFAAGELALFSINACVNVAILWSVPLRLRQLAMSTTTVAIHISGDVPAPPIIGRIQDASGNWRLSLGVVTCALGVSTLLFAASAALARRMPNGGAAAAAPVEETQPQQAGVDLPHMRSSDQAPLLAVESGRSDDVEK